MAIARESIRLAFVAALQHLPPKQRAVLILREVLRWHADEVAELLDTSVASVNSALQRARATLAQADVGDLSGSGELDPEEQALVARYVDAFERYDMDALTALLHEDATWSMPPFDLWLQTHDDIVRWCLGPGAGCEGSRLIPVHANGAPAFAQYKPADDGSLAPWSLQILDVRDGGGSPGSCSSSTPPAGSRSSGCRSGYPPVADGSSSHGSTPARPTKSSRPRSPIDAPRTAVGASDRRAASARRARASTVVRSFGAS